MTYLKKLLNIIHTCPPPTDKNATGIVGESATTTANALRYSDGDSTSGNKSADLSLVCILCVAIALSFLIARR